MSRKGRIRGFTLIEMMIVVALIATLMTIVLRLSTVSQDESKRNTTVVRLASLENCLSGYYAAYGSYPPVQLHNSRDINQEADPYGVHSSGKKSSLDLWGWDVQKFRRDIAAYGYSTQQDERDAWSQVETACKAQPLSLETPDPDTEGLDDAFDSLIEVVRKHMNSGEYKNYPKNPKDRSYQIWKNGFTTIYANLGSVDNEINWRDAQICKFGLMSYLLPRYQAMMGWRDVMFDGEGNSVFDQWNSNNGAVPHDPFTGDERTWKEINEKVREANRSTGSARRRALAYLESIPSEAATSRWLPNLEKACKSDMSDLSYFGIPINAIGSGDMFNVSSDKGSSPPNIRCYSPEGGESGRNLYHLNQITVCDGWGTEFFYYSAAPYQSYQIWSAGKNQRTFPVWIPRQQLESDSARKCVAVWTEDDIRGMSN